MLTNVFISIVYIVIVTIFMPFGRIYGCTYVQRNDRKYKNESRKRINRNNKKINKYVAVHNNYHDSLRLFGMCVVPSLHTALPKLNTNMGRIK